MVTFPRGPHGSPGPGDSGDPDRPIAAGAARSTLGLEVRSIGWRFESADPDRINRGWRFDAFALMMAGRSGGRFANEALPDRDLAAWTPFWLLPGIWHRYGPRVGNDWEEFLIFCDGPLLRDLRARAILAPERAVLQAGCGRGWTQRWLAAVASAEAGDVDGLIAAVLELIHRACGRPSLPTAADHPAVGLARRMATDPARDWDLDAEAAAAGLGRSALRQAFARLVGEPPHRHLLGLRLELAARHLHDGTSVGQALRSAGFNDHGHFTRCFKRRFGIAPRDFQRLAGG